VPQSPFIATHHTSGLCRREQITPGFHKHGYFWF
jgi:hypothetical protein